MTHALIRGLVVLALLLCPLMAVAEEAASETPSTEADSSDVERVIDTLEDPDARAELVRELRVLLEAERAAAEPEDDALPSAGGLVDTLREVVVDVWTAITTVDPRQLLTSIGISVAIIVVALILRWGIVRLLQGLYARVLTGGQASAEEVMEVADIGTRDSEATPEERSQLPAGVVRLINLVIAVLAVALIAESWGAGVASLLRTDLGARMAEAGLAIGLILIFTLVAWHIAGLVVARLLTLATGHRDQARTARRLNTLVPLLRSALQGLIGVLAALLILSELGVNIAPLLAGAGIVGLAIGFGAQTLVKDLITGVTILMEDGATLGDVVEVAGYSGVVEEMRIRVIRLRDLAGAVHLIPYSEVTSITNFTRDFSFYLIELGVAYREDTDEVCAVLHEVVDGMKPEAPFRREILEPLEILGVDKFADSAVVIKARIKTVPGRQWAIGREFNRRLKKAFDTRGIEIPFPHTTVYFGEPKEGLAPPARLALTGSPEGEPIRALASTEPSS